MEMFKGDVLDRYSILCLKIKRLPKNKEVTGEYELFKKEVVNLIKNYPEIQTNLDCLYEYNSKIWDLESDIRKGKEGNMTLEEVGKRALSIRNWNAYRVEEKNKVNAYFDEFIEVKVDHSSEN